MKRKKAWQYLNKLFKKMRQHFKKFVHTQSREALHAFRVQVKKIKSLLTLLQAGISNKKLLKTFKPVKKLFKRTGAIRDVQMHEKQANENRIDITGFKEKQDALQNEEMISLLHRRQKYLYKIKKVKQQLQHNVHGVHQHTIEQFLAKQIADTKQLLSSHNFSEQLHDGRKMLKHVLYSKKLMPGAVSKKIHVNFDDVDAMQQAIGDWHDNKLALDYFSKKIPVKHLEILKQKQEELQQKITLKAAVFN